jgi:UDP-N-acetylglucosamine acyltransferase
MAQVLLKSIHETAVVEDGASVGDGSNIGPFCLVGRNVTLGKRVKLYSHVVITGNTTVGDDTTIWPFASIGHQPQDLKYQGESNNLIIGARNKIRESVSINPGTKGGGGITKIGDDCLFMLGSHIGHDSVIGDFVVIANNSAIAGHVTIGNNVTIGGLTGVHQFCRVGEGTMIGALSMITNDIIPFTTFIV